VSHGRESELQDKRLARFKRQSFHEGSPKDRQHNASQRLERYREALQRTFTH